jgi:hypothetical protein
VTELFTTLFDIYQTTCRDRSNVAAIVNDLFRIVLAASRDSRCLYGGFFAWNKCTLT